VNVADYDAVVAVIGETPYAEGDGDIGPSGTLRHSSRYPEDLAVLEAVAGKGKPVVTVFVAGRPLWVNDLLNLSDTFVAAWLPGSEGKGVADLLVAGPKKYAFTGTLSFSWPKTVCQTSLNAGSADYAPLFKLGYGLRGGTRSRLGKLDANFAAGGCGVSNSFPVFGQADRASFPLAIRSGAQVVALGADLNATVALPGVSVQTSQINTQQDAKQVSWTGPASVEARGSKAMLLPAAAAKDGALRFDTIVGAAPAGRVTLAMACGASCDTGGGTGGTPLDATRLFARLAGKGKQVVKVPLACFTARGADLARVEAPFVLASDAAFTAAFANIEIAGGAALDADAVRCEELR
jgi:beta-glucosidase